MIGHREKLAARKAWWWSHEGLDDIEGGIKCPRCYRRTGEGHFNFDGLCDRCCRAILSDFPDHWSVAGIKEAFAKQKTMWKRQG